MAKSATSVRLTPKQKKLKAEIDSMASIAGMDHWAIHEYHASWRTSKLFTMKDHLVRGRIIMRYTQIDGLLSSTIAKIYFPQAGRKGNFSRLWRTKRFQAFSHHILDGLYLLNKLRLVNDIRPVAKKARETVEQLNAVRNAVAHSYYPQNRYQFRRHKKVLWSGSDIYLLGGFVAFDFNSQQAVDYFIGYAFGRKQKTVYPLIED